MHGEETRQVADPNAKVLRPETLEAPAGDNSRGGFGFALS
jgi:hypothetical protein